MRSCALPCATPRPSCFLRFTRDSGIPILEAMSQRCPMALANASCFPEIAHEAAAYFDPLNPNSICDVVDTLISDQALRERLVAEGEILVGEYSVPKMVAKTCDVYRSVLDQMPGPGA